MTDQQLELLKQCAREWMSNTHPTPNMDAKEAYLDGISDMLYVLADSTSYHHAFDRAQAAVESVLYPD